MIILGLFCLSAYVLGALNSSYYFVWLFQQKDIRRVHSGTAGARNVGRIYGKTGFFFIFCIDFCKGAILYWLPFFYDITSVLDLAEVRLLGCFFCILGHSYPPQLHFKGGKGLSIYAGLLLFLAPHLFFVGFVLLAIGQWVGKNSLLLLFTCCVTNILYFLEYPTVEKLMIFLPTSVILWRHRTNLIKNQ